ncbi:histidine phosphatase family protein [Propionibacteriaceae bacterium Y1923]|uniref:histidine phosphatase family protein n=1 Tax=Aestuariimicrobium sp. Y1814 TaxID=3418742 RepID=UPI003C20C667
MSTTLILIRHGLTDWNAAGRFQGQADVPLNEIGHLQAASMARAVSGMRPEVLYASPLTRTRQTMAPLAEAVGLAVAYDDRLKEIHVGLWEGYSGEEVDQLDPEFFPGLRAGKDMRRSAEGETAEETGARFADAVRDIVAAHPGKRIAVVSHGVALKQGIAKFLGWDWERSQQLGHFDNCSWATLELHHDSHWRLTGYGINAARMMSLMQDPSAEQRDE